MRKNLRRHGKKPNWKGGGHAGRGHIPDRVNTSEHPNLIEEKMQIAELEADTIIGKAHSRTVVSLADRATKYTLPGRVDRRTADAVMIRPIGSGSRQVHTITSDGCVSRMASAIFFSGL